MKVWLQVTSGRGPVECCRVVVEVCSEIICEGSEQGLEVEFLAGESGPVKRTWYSSIITVEGVEKQVEDFVKSWEGTVLWITNSPYRLHHKRKNWFVGVKRLEVAKVQDFKENEVEFTTTRSSGPGGQHVNKTESCVVAIHLPTGIKVTSSNRSSQFQNKQIAIELLKAKLATLEAEKELKVEQTNWQNHNELERGNPVRTFKRRLT